MQRWISYKLPLFSVTGLYLQSCSRGRVDALWPHSSGLLTLCMFNVTLNSNHVVNAHQSGQSVLDYVYRLLP